MEKNKLIVVIYVGLQRTISERLEHEAKMAREYEGIIWETVATLKPSFSRDGNQFCFLFGENFQEGIAGFGKTVWLAAENFYNALHLEKIEKW